MAGFSGAIGRPGGRAGRTSWIGPPRCWPSTRSTSTGPAVEMPPVPGDPDTLRASGRQVGSAAACGAFAGDERGDGPEPLDPSLFAGPAGDRVRAFLDQLHFASVAAATAMDRVASAIPRVALAIEEAQKDETFMNKADDRYHQARDVYQQAAAAVTRAANDVMTAATRVISTASVAALDPVHGSAVAAAVQRELHDAEHRLDQARHQAASDQRLREEAQRAYRRARHTFDQADDRRRRQLRSFAVTVRGGGSGHHRLCPADRAGAGKPVGVGGRGPGPGQHLADPRIHTSGGAHAHPGGGHVGRWAGRDSGRRRPSGRARGGRGLRHLR